jgi:hypothetical protein
MEKLVPHALKLSSMKRLQSVAEYMGYNIMGKVYEKRS